MLEPALTLKTALSPWQIYQHALATEQITRDAAQLPVIRYLDQLYSQLLNPPATKWWQKKPPTPKGLYVYGDVGRGKSTLCNWFFDAIKDEVPSVRTHFHTFMTDIKKQLHDNRSKGHGDPIIHIAKQFAKTHTVLYLDEFFVVDITHAMVLKRLFETLFSEGIVLIATSNIAPDNLYAGGLQRDAFLPFIPLLKQHTVTHCLKGSRDFRQEQGKTSHWYVRDKTRFQTLFKNMTQSLDLQPVDLPVQGHTFHIPKLDGGTAMMTFSELCEGNVGISDYKAFTNKAHTLFISQIPKLTDDLQDAARRFLNFIDIAYESNIQIITLAETDIDKICHIDTMKEAFKRAQSRLKILCG